MAESNEALEEHVPGDVTAATASAPLFSLLTRGKGYERTSVDAFLLRARAAFEDGVEIHDLTAQEVREVSFPLVRRGYDIAQVDAALGRIEDAFASQERARAIDAIGANAWVRQQRELAQEILNRLSRPQKLRFTRVNVLRYGYRIDEVDLVSEKIASHLADGTPLTVEQLRSVAFRMQRGGYHEAQVDAVLDAVVEVILAVG